jgi:hypothetical protein
MDISLRIPSIIAYPTTALAAPIRILGVLSLEDILLSRDIAIIQPAEAPIQLTAVLIYKPLLFYLIKITLGFDFLGFPFN